MNQLFYYIIYFRNGYYNKKQTSGYLILIKYTKIKFNLMFIFILYNKNKFTKKQKHQNLRPDVVTYRTDSAALCEMAKRG